MTDFEYDPEIAERARQKLIAFHKSTGLEATPIRDAPLTDEEREHLGKWFVNNCS
jgi:hypothetical protein